MMIDDRVQKGLWQIWTLNCLNVPMVEYPQGNKLVMRVAYSRMQTFPMNCMHTSGFIVGEIFVIFFFDCTEILTTLNLAVFVH